MQYTIVEAAKDNKKGTLYKDYRDFIKYQETNTSIKSNLAAIDDPKSHVNTILYNIEVDKVNNKFVAKEKQKVWAEQFISTPKTNVHAEYKKFEELYNNLDSTDVKNRVPFTEEFTVLQKGNFTLKLEISTYLYYGSVASTVNKILEIGLDKNYFNVSEEVYKLENITAILKNLTANLIKGNNVPAIYNLEEISYENDIYGPISLEDGTIFYLPKDLKKADRRLDFISKVSEMGKYPGNNLVYINPKTRKLVYSNSKGDLVSFDVNGAPISEETISKIFNSSIDFVFTDKRKGTSLANLWTFTSRFNVSGSTLLKDVDKKHLKEVLEEQKIEYISLKNNVVPPTYFKAMGIMQLLLNNLDKISQIEAKVSDKRKAFNEATAEDLPSIPMLRSDLAFLPHQGEILPKLASAGETAIIDVGTGGGKTLIMLSDALRLMGEGVYRPLFVMPNSLVSQWVDQINYFTDNQLNVIVLSTETLKNWGDKDLKNLAATAPKNSVFITTFSFLTLKSIETKDESGKSYIFPMVDFILSDVRPGSLYIDEAHNIKNVDAKKTQACMALRKIKYRRIGTGTLISNTPDDLIGQLAVLDPNIIGSRKEFNERYGLSIGRTGKVKAWIPGAAEKIRNDLRNNSFYLLYRELDWAPALPSIEYIKHIVPLSGVQQNIYKVLVKDTIDEIKSDPLLAEQWANFTSNSEEEPTLSVAILGKLAILEKFLTAPTSVEFVNLNPDESVKRSPKLDKIDALISESIRDGYKVIVATHYKDSAYHLQKFSKFSEQSVYFDASNKDSIKKFNEDDNIKVIFAVVQSLSEGHNLQIANRVIVADVDWTPGKLKQLMGRIYRPHLKKNDKGELENLNANKKVYIDTILADNSADIVKYMFQTSKKIFNSNVMEGSKIIVPEIPSINNDTLTSTIEQLKGDVTLARDDEFNDWFFSAVEERKKDGMGELVPVKIGKPIPGEKINVPWVAGTKPPVVEATTSDTKNGEKSTKNVETKELDKWLSSKGFKTLREAKSAILNLPVKTEVGIGTIVGVWGEKVKVLYEDGESKYSSPDKITVFDGKLEQLPEENIPKLDDTTNMTKDQRLNLNLVLYNNILTITSDKTDADNEDLVNFNFQYQGNYFYHKVTSKDQGSKLLEEISKKYDIKGTTEINLALRQIKKTPVINTEIDIKNFFRIKHTKAKSGSVKLYTMVENGTLYFVYDKDTNPGVKLKGFLPSSGFYYFFSKNRDNINKKVKEITDAGYTISNPELFNEEAKDLKVAPLPETETAPPKKRGRPLGWRKFKEEDQRPSPESMEIEPLNIPPVTPAETKLQEIDRTKLGEIVMDETPEDKNLTTVKVFDKLLKYATSKVELTSLDDFIKNIFSISDFKNSPYYGSKTYNSEIDNLIPELADTGYIDLLPKSASKKEKESAIYYNGKFNTVFKFTKGSTKFIKLKVPEFNVKPTESVETPSQPGDFNKFKEDFDLAFNKIDRDEGGDNFVSLVDLRKDKNLKKYSRETFDKYINDLRRGRYYTLSAASGRATGTTTEERNSGIEEEGSLLLWVSRLSPDYRIKETKGPLGWKVQEEPILTPAETKLQEIDRTAMPEIVMDELPETVPPKKRGRPAKPKGPLGWSVKEETKPVLTPVEKKLESKLLSNIVEFSKDKDPGALLNIYSFKVTYKYGHEIDNELIDLHNKGTIRLAVKKDPKAFDTKHAVLFKNKDYHLMVLKKTRNSS